MQSNDAKFKHNPFSASPSDKLHAEQLQQWLLSAPIGREILRKERLFFQQSVGHLFGKYSLQIGLNSINLLQGNKIQNHYTLHSDLKGDIRFLPFATNSIDLIICPHVLEFTHDYQYALLEFYRILAPNGRIIISCFNRYSWMGLLKQRISLLQKANLISLGQLKSQLQNLNLRLEGGKFFSYCPPFSSQEKLTQFSWLNKIGDRWLPTLANSFALIACKEIVIPHLIKCKEMEFFPRLQPSLGTARVCNKR